jgi:uncharacterized membrane protein YgcG
MPSQRSNRSKSGGQLQETTSEESSSSPLPPLSVSPLARLSSSQSSSSSSRTTEVFNLRADAVLSAIGKAEFGSREVLEIVAREHTLFLSGPRRIALRLWLACRVGTEQLFETLPRDQALETILHALVTRPPDAAQSAVGAAGAVAGVPPLQASQSSAADLSRSVAAVLDSVSRSQSSPAAASSSPPPTPRRSARKDDPRHGRDDVLEAAIFGLYNGVTLPEAELHALSVVQRQAYDAVVATQRTLLARGGRTVRRATQGPDTEDDVKSAPSVMRIAMVTQPASSSSAASSAPPLESQSRQSWTQSIPTVNFSSSVSSRSAPKSHLHSRKRKPTTSMDELSGEGSLPSSDASPSSGDTSPSESSSSDSDSHSSSDSESSSSSSRERSVRLPSSRDSSRRRRRRSQSSSITLLRSSRQKRALRRFLKALGVNTYKQAITPEVIDKIHDQTPVQWWRSVSRNSTVPDIRSVNEGLCLAMCLEAGDNVHFMREIICRRLLGLSFVVGKDSTKNDRLREWTLASALLPLNAMSSVSVDTQRMIEKEARRTQRSLLSTTGSASPQSNTGRRQKGNSYYIKDEDSGSAKNKQFRHRGNSRGRSSGGGGGGGGGSGGGGGRGSHSGAPSAQAQHGQQRAGGSGANAQ